MVGECINSGSAKATTFSSGTWAYRHDWLGSGMIPGQCSAWTHPWEWGDTRNKKNRLVVLGLATGISARNLCNISKTPCNLPNSHLKVLPCSREETPLKWIRHGWPKIEALDTKDCHLGMIQHDPTWPMGMGWSNLGSVFRVPGLGPKFDQRGGDGIRITWGMWGSMEL